MVRRRKEGKQEKKEVSRKKMEEVKKKRKKKHNKGREERWKKIFGRQGARGSKVNGQENKVKDSRRTEDNKDGEEIKMERKVKDGSKQ